MAEDLGQRVDCFYAKSKRIFQFLFNWWSFAWEEEFGRLMETQVKLELR